MTRTFTREAIAAYRQAAGRLVATLRTSNDVQVIAEALASYDLALFDTWGLPASDALVWAFATGQVDHEGRPL